MKNLICIILILILVTPTYGWDLFDNQYSPGVGPEFQKFNFANPENPNHCRPESTAFFAHSQSGLINFFQATSCKSAGKEILGNLMTFETCAMVYKCSSEQELPLSQKEKGQINFELMSYIIRENLREEVKKYNQAQSRDLRDVLSFVSKMPEVYKQQIHFCPDYKQSSTDCLKESSFNKLAKVVFTSAISEGTAPAKSVSRRQRSASLSQSSSESSPAQLEGEQLRTQLSELYEARSAANIANSAMNRNSSDSDFSNFVKFETDWDSTIHKMTTSFEPTKDILLQSIAEISKTEDVTKLSKDQLNKKLMTAFVKFSVDGNDLLVSHDRQRSRQIFEETLERIHITAEDLLSPTRENLSKKLNAVRVAIANDTFKHECDRSVVSIAQMCSKVSEALKTGVVNGSTLNHSDLFSKMKSSLQKSGGPSGDLVSREALLDQLSERSDYYGQYVNYTMNLNSCKESFGEMDTLSGKNAKVLAGNPGDEVRRLIEQEEKSVQAVKESAARRIAEASKTDESFRVALSSSGLNVEALTSHAYKSMERRSSLGEDESMRSSDSVRYATEVPKKGQPPVQEEVRRPSEVSVTTTANTANTANTIMDSRQGSNNQEDFSDSDLERLTDRVNRRRNPRIPTKDNSDETGSNSGSDISDLRNEIAALRDERMKASQAALSGDRQSSSPGVINSTTQESIQGQNTLGSSANAFRVSANSLSPSEVLPQARSNLAGGSGDYIAEVPSQTGPQNQPAGYKGQAGTNALNPQGPGKGVADKAQGSNALVLTQKGDGAVDPATILENPNEKDISLFMEKTKGEPFIIRENGEFVRVTPILGSNGKPLLSNDGKMKFQKIKLTKSQQEFIVKEQNPLKAAKEIGIETTRLFRLRSLLREVQRE